MTDHTVYVVRTGWFRSEVREVLASYPLEPSPPTVDFERTSSSRGAITVNGTTLSLQTFHFEAAEEIVGSVRSGAR
ncbi:MAG: hypothetical protein M3065_00320 [Actinomycetota bacterium]|nr:hypothetical protein [Actinomycetota bacterium]